MDKFLIKGGYPLSGTVLPAGNKNAALPVLAASLLTEEEVVVSNVPRIRDVDAMLGLLEDIGVRVDRSGRAHMPPPGGDVIGRRRLDPHLDAFRAMGATVEMERDIVLEAPRGL